MRLTFRIRSPLNLKVEVPKLQFDLLRSGRAIDRQLIRTLNQGDTLYAGSLPSLLNIYTYGNFDFERLDMTLSGPYRHDAMATKFPHALFNDESGFAPYIGSYTLVAKAYKERRLSVINLIYGKIESDVVSFAEAFSIIKRKGG